MILFPIIFTVFYNLCVCQDFHAGVFTKDDILVAQDRLYKERVPYRSVDAKYGRIFECPISYFQVVNRLGTGSGPKVRVIRGGLGQEYLVLRLTSPYNYPISVDVYVGCQKEIIINTEDENTATSQKLSYIFTTHDTETSNKYLLYKTKKKKMG